MLSLCQAQGGASVFCANVDTRAMSQQGLHDPFVPFPGRVHQGRSTINLKR